MRPAPPMQERDATPTIGADPGEDWAVRVLHWFATTVPVVLVALVVAPLVVEGGTVLPWAPVMPELGTMAAVATRMVEGQVVFGTATTANFGWTPFAAIALAPLALSSLVLWQLVLVVGTVSALQHLLRRLFGLRGQALLLAGVAVVVLVEPVRMTLGVGQISLLVLLLVVLDLVEPRLPAGRARARLFPVGVLTGVAAGIAVWPVWVLLALLVSRRRRVALTGLATAAGCFLLGWIVMPGQSEGLLEGGQRSTWADALWASNQSLAAALARWHAPEPVAVLAGLAVAALGAWAAGRWWDREPLTALGLVLVAALMPLDPAWTWQFVAVLVVGAALARGWARLPRALAWPALVWVVWTAVALPQLLASPGPVPGPAENLVAGVGPVVAVVLVVLAAVLVPPRPRGGHRVVEKLPK